MNFAGSMLYSYFDKCHLDNTLDKWQLITPHKEHLTVENFEVPLKNDLHHYFPMLPFWLKENGWQHHEKAIIDESERLWQWI